MSSLEDYLAKYNSQFKSFAATADDSSSDDDATCDTPQHLSRLKVERTTSSSSINSQGKELTNMPSTTSSSSNDEVIYTSIDSNENGCATGCSTPDSHREKQRQYLEGISKTYSVYIPARGSQSTTSATSSNGSLSNASSPTHMESPLAVAPGSQAAADERLRIQISKAHSMENDSRSPSTSTPTSASSPTTDSLPRRAKLQRLLSTNDIMNYQNLQKIGKGAFGEVWKAVNAKTGKFMAVKRLPLGNDSFRSLQMYQEEIAFLKQFKHKHIVQYFGSQLEDDNFFIIFLEYASEGSLRQFIKNFTRVNDRIVMAQVYVRQILEGLAYLHDHNIVHRDIKPDNVLLDRDGDIKLADFGCAKVINGLQQGSFLTMRGTPEYASPEWIRGEVENNPSKVDIWSLGVTLFELTLGYHLWKDLDRVQAIYQIGKLTESPNVDAIPVPSLRDFVAQCLRVDANDRPSAKDLLSHPFLRDNLSHLMSPNDYTENSHDNNTSEAGSDTSSESFSTSNSYFSTLKTAYTTHSPESIATPRAEKAFRSMVRSFSSMRLQRENPE